MVTKVWAGQLGFDSWQEQCKVCFFSPLCPDWLCDPPSFLFSGYQEQSAQGMKLITHFHQVPRLICGAVPPHPQHVFMAWFLIN
jgi:hypothetical protein